MQNAVQHSQQNSEAETGTPLEEHQRRRSETWIEIAEILNERQRLFKELHEASRRSAVERAEALAAAFEKVSL